MQLSLHSRIAVACFRREARREVEAFAHVLAALEHEVFGQLFALLVVLERRSTAALSTQSAKRKLINGPTIEYIYIEGADVAF